MPVLLQLQDAHKSYGPQNVLDNASVALKTNEKVGFIGRNGAGKSTLCRILLEQEELDRGEIIRHPTLRVGYLQQHDPFEPGESALDFLMRDSGEPDWKCGEVAAEFEIKGDYLEGPVKALSGGWQTRVKLASLLLHDPNLLILDEPTNFLDLRTQILLEHFLRHFKGAVLVVSHDRGFLKAICDNTLELSRGQLTMYSGNVDQFFEAKDVQRQHAERVNAATEAKMKQLERFIEKNRANAGTAAQARNKAKQLDRLELIEVEEAETTVRIRVPEVQQRKGPALRIEGMSIGYPDHTVAENIHFEIDHGSRTAVVGDNGQGKTTLLRTLVGSLDPVNGEPRWGHNCELGVYAQHVYTSLPQDWTVQQYLESESARGVTTQQVLDVAGSFLFRGPLIQKPIKVLSGGERARLCLAGLLLSACNVLILDEPGNHLDVETLEAMADALIDYQGTVIFTSHDRHFVKRIATQVIEVADGHVADYPGDYETYLYRVEKEIDDHEAARGGGSSGGGKAGKKNKRKKGSDDPRKKLNKVEKKIASLDDERMALQKKFVTLTDPKEAEKIHNQMEEIKSQLSELEEEWLELNEEIDGEVW
ncbi:ABC-F family ATP-binding cassette domain-containing protein [Rubinisphaera brasiliensis]|uniref:ABC transporter related protein n=1 Tax=Rubinisphaera brasiliensis (strain ATCC 49424 / DSM 5305 / JCM 21570 / IAM 15109 / NBRC 103401 / IFAM 1448) TaxID=756272 RepID=F0SHV5_RUBBR|nr:ABC-F family ATP-binding cassette domain-containing protein [Rubinisphaera brasiliensis]ADY59585.1 ABC transporter related protein [Rubinisphaera brasiliensis DSM 5305]